MTSENPAVAYLKARKAAEQRVFLTRRECQVEGGWKQSSQIAKENAGLLHRVLDGVVVRITSESFYDHLIALASAPPAKARQPVGRFQKGVRRTRPRTQAELDGLKAGNARRAEEARKRRTANA